MKTRKFLATITLAVFSLGFIPAATIPPGGAPPVAEAREPAPTVAPQGALTIVIPPEAAGIFANVTSTSGPPPAVEIDPDLDFNDEDWCEDAFGELYWCGDLPSDDCPSGHGDAYCWDDFEYVPDNSCTFEVIGIMVSIGGLGTITGWAVIGLIYSVGGFIRCAF